MRPELDLIVSRALEHKRRFAERGSNFVMLITPSKNPIVYELMAKLRRKNIEIFHYSETPDFDEKGVYRSNDSHWTPPTVAVYARKLADFYRNKMNDVSKRLQTQL